MANDNTLGAPTEGLGQTVTFAAGGRQGVPQTSASNRQSLRLDARGGGAQRTSQALRVQEAQPDPTFQALAKMGGEMLRPHIEAERQVRYVEGMQRAAQGEAITEIVEEQPWYSKLFGSTSLVDGARAYSATAKATSIAVDMETKMDELRKLSPPEFAKYSAGVLTKASTGDVPTDMLVSQQIGSVLPQVMKSQAKAHLRYKQEVLDEGIGASHTAGFASLGAVASAARQGGTTDALDVLTNQLHLAGQLTPPPDVDRDHFNKLLSNSAVKSILSGNLDTAAFLDQTKILASLSPQQQVAIKEATNRARSEARMKLPPEFADELAGVLRASNDGSSLAELKAKTAAFNANYKKYSGDPKDYFGAANLAAEINQWHASQDRDLAATRKAAEKADGAAAKAQAVLNYQISIGDKLGDPMGINVVGESKDDLRMGWASLASKAHPTALARARFVQASLGNVDEAFRDKLQSMITLAASPEFKDSAGKTPGNPTGLYEAYQVYDELLRNGNQAVAQEYAGKGGRIMAIYSKLAMGQQPTAENTAIWYHRAVTESLMPPEKVTAAMRTTHVKELSSSIPDWVPFRADTFRNKNPEALADLLAPYIDTSLTNGQADAALLKAKAGRKVDGLAGWHWALQPGVSNFREALARDAKVASNEYNTAFDFAIGQFASRVGLDTITSVGQFNDDATGDPQVWVMGKGSSGDVKTMFVKASWVREAWDQNKKIPATLADKPIELKDPRGLGKSATELALEAKDKRK